MNTLGLTGGIGAGKTTVAKFFEQKNIAVFYADDQAKKLYIQNSDVQQNVISLLGEKAYSNGQLNRSHVAHKVFSDEHLLESLNHIIHPALEERFLNWKTEQTSTFVVKEAAILFESGMYQKCQATLLVTADQELRIERVMQREPISQEQVLQRMQAQWTEERKVELSDFILFNNSDLQHLKERFELLFPRIEQTLA